MLIVWSTVCSGWVVLESCDKVADVIEEQVSLETNTRAA
jgi:hypothetical protein